MLGVSRPTVREALIALEVEGRLRIRVGSGIYVTAPPSIEPSPAPTPIEGPFEVLRARAFVESAVAEEAARSAKPEDIARLDSILAEVGGPALSIEHWVALDRSFHRAVVATLGNVVLLRAARAAHRERFHLAGRACGARGHPRCHRGASSGRRQSRHARAFGAVAPALLARFRRGAFRSGGHRG
jgi:DNA-binding FadR family transcriptional regulator